jgi:biopolymer transport protein ExbD
MALGKVPGGDDESADDGVFAEINITPLTDIFLVLLIIFMVTSSALTNQGSNVDLPRSAPGAGDTTGVVVTATADGKVEVDGRALTLDELGAALAASLQKAPVRSVVLRGDRTMVLEQAVQIMTIAKTAGADKISIATAPLAAGGR